MTYLIFLDNTPTPEEFQYLRRQLTTEPPKPQNIRQTTSTHNFQGDIRT